MNITSRRQIMILSIIVLCWLFLHLGGCVTTKKRIDTLAYQPLQENQTLAIDSITIDYHRQSNCTEYPVEEILVALGKEHGLDIRTREPEACYTLSLLVQEARFTRNLEALCSTAAIATVHDSETRVPVAKIVYNEESAATIESFYYLYSVLDQVVEALSHEFTKKR